MHRNSASFLRVLLILAASAPLAGPLSAGKVQATVGGPRLFEENAGQFDPRARFLMRGGSYQAFVQPDSVVYTWFSQRDRSPGDPSHRPGWNREATIRMTLVGASHGAAVEGVGSPIFTLSHLDARFDDHGGLRPPQYERVSSRGVYPGVEVQYYLKGAQLEHDFILAPQADPGSIRMRFDGVDSAEISDQGDLVLISGQHRLVQQAPFAYQGSLRKPEAVEASYVRFDDGSFGYRLGTYDTTGRLVIDPIAWTTYAGGDGVEIVVDVAAGPDGEADVLFFTNSATFPVTSEGELIRTGQSTDRAGVLSVRRSDGQYVQEATALLEFSFNVTGILRLDPPADASGSDSGRAGQNADYGENVAVYGGRDPGDGRLRFSVALYNRKSDSTFAITAIEDVGRGQAAFGALGPPGAESARISIAGVLSSTPEGFTPSEQQQTALEGGGAAVVAVRAGLGRGGSLAYDLVDIRGGAGWDSPTALAVSRDGARIALSYREVLTNKNFTVEYGLSAVDGLIRRLRESPTEDVHVGAIAFAGDHMVAAGRDADNNLVVGQATLSNSLTRASFHPVFGPIRRIERFQQSDEDPGEFKTFFWTDQTDGLLPHPEAPFRFEAGPNAGLSTVMARFTFDEAGDPSMVDESILLAPSPIFTDEYSDGSWAGAGNTQVPIFNDQAPAPIEDYEAARSLFTFSWRPQQARTLAMTDCQFGLISEAAAGQNVSFFLDAAGVLTSQAQSLPLPHAFPRSDGSEVEIALIPKDSGDPSYYPVGLFFGSEVQFNGNIPEAVGPGGYSLAYRVALDGGNGMFQLLPPLAEAEIEISPNGRPCVYTQPDGTAAGVVIRDTDEGRQTFFLAESPMEPGDFVTIFGTGVAPAEPPTTYSLPTILRDSADETIRETEVVCNGPFKSPEFVGLWQWNLGPIPRLEDLPSGEHVIEVRVGSGILSNTFRLPISVP